MKRDPLSVSYCCCCIYSCWPFLSFSLFLSVDWMCTKSRTDIFFVPAATSEAQTHNTMPSYSFCRAPTSGCFSLVFFFFLFFLFSSHLIFYLFCFVDVPVASAQWPRTTSNLKPPGGSGDSSSASFYCQPAVTRGLYWNWTRSGDSVVQPCPGGATGYAKWFCTPSATSSGAIIATWYPSSPDLSECKSVWLTSLDSRIGEGDSIISIANDLAQVTHSKTLYGGDMMAAARLLRQMAVKMAADLQAFPDWRQREAIVTELVQSVVRAGSSLLGSSQSLAWKDLGLTARAEELSSPPLQSADGESLEENAFLLANTISRQKSVFQSFDNIRKKH